MPEREKQMEWKQILDFKEFLLAAGVDNQVISSVSQDKFCSAFRIKKRLAEITSGVNPRSDIAQAIAAYIANTSIKPSLDVENAIIKITESILETKGFSPESSLQKIADNCNLLGCNNVRDASRNRLKGFYNNPDK